MSGNIEIYGEKNPFHKYSRKIFVTMFFCSIIVQCTLIFVEMRGNREKSGEIQRNTGRDRKVGEIQRNTRREGSVIESME